MPYVFSEITGYLTTLMCAHYARTEDARVLESARGAAEWLLRTAHPETGGFRCLWPLAPSRFDYKFGQIYAFDTGVIVSGLVDVYRATGDDRYLAAAVRAGDWLLRDMRKPGGAFRPIYEIDTGSTPESGLGVVAVSGRVSHQGRHRADEPVRRDGDRRLPRCVHCRL